MIHKRLSVIANHLGSHSTEDVSFNIARRSVTNRTSTEKKRSANDVVVVCALRTPVGKAKGQFAELHWTELLAHVLKSVMGRTSVPFDAVEDIQVGIAQAQLGGAYESRMAAFNAGFPSKVSVATTNRFCSSGLQAFSNVASAISSGYMRIGIASGVESMSTTPRAQTLTYSEKSQTTDLARDCLMPMGITSENVAKRFGINRERQDQFAVESQKKALAARSSGKFTDEIEPVPVTITDADGNKSIRKVEHDEGIRPDTSLESLAKLKPAFSSDGLSTAGNSSQISDGAAAVLVMTREEAEKRGLPILARYVSYAVVGVDPAVMGIGPAFAIPKVLSNAKLRIEDIDIFEINEAFASQALYCIQELGIPKEKVNPNGGAIALGHPIGATGVRMICTLLHEMRREKLRYGVVSMCVGSGMGAAGLFECEY